MFDWFYSDPHFGHRAIIDYACRPFADVEDMREGLIHNFNSVVKPCDDVLWLGDCFFLPDAEAEVILSRMNGRHYLVCGNHDKRSRRMVDIGFQFATKQLVWNQGGRTYRGSHFPWHNAALSDGREYLKKGHPKYNKDEVLVHGHTHSGCKHMGGNAIHCGVDAWDYMPAAASEVAALLSKNLDL